MTTTVKKGAGRATATERRNRHSQQTPLPPKAGVVEDARELIATVTPPQYGYMKQAELYARAVELGLTLPKSAPKGKLLTAILEAERAEAKVDATLRTPKLDAKLDEAFAGGTITTTGQIPQRQRQKENFNAAIKLQKELGARVDSKSGVKATAFAAEALRLDWKAEAVLTAGDLVTVTATRGEEVIVIQWAGGVFQDNCSYRHNGRTPIKLRNASAAKQRMAVPPATADQEAAKVTAHKSVRAKSEKAPRGHRSLPFTDASLDQEVLDALYGKRITWVNKISELNEEDRVPALAEGVRLGDGTPGRKKQHHAPRITEGPRGRVLEFVGVNGFRSVALASITRVR